MQCTERNQIARVWTRPVTRILCGGGGGGGGGAYEANADPTTEMYFLSSDPFI